MIEVAWSDVSDEPAAYVTTVAALGHHNEGCHIKQRFINRREKLEPKYRYFSTWVRKIVKSDYYLHVRLSVRMEELISHWTGFDKTDICVLSTLTRKLKFN